VAARRLGIIALAATCITVLATPAVAETRRELHIPADKAATALVVLGKKTGVNILFSADTLEGVRALPVDGVLTAAEAARLMLAQTDLEVFVDRAGALIIRKRAPSHARKTEPIASIPVTPDAEPVDLEEVIVTARRRDELLRTVPVAVTALSQATLNRRGIVSPADISRSVPSLQAGTSNTSRNSIIFTLRGQGEIFGGSEPAVVTYFDEMPVDISSPGLLFDLSNIQVLKGPQGTLFGRNTTGGAILLTPQRPAADFSGYATVGAGAFDLGRVTGAINVPVIEDRLLIRLAADAYHRDGFTREVATGELLDERSFRSVRASSVWRIGNDFENRTMVTFVKSSTGGSGSVLIDAAAGSQAARSLPTLFFVLADQQARGVRATKHSVPREYDKNETFLAINTTEARLNNALSAKAIVGYRTYKQASPRDTDGSELIIVDADSPHYTSGTAMKPSQKQLTGELQLRGSWDPVDVIVGVFGDRRRPWPGGTQDAQQLLGSPVTNLTIARRKYDSRAAFAHATFSLAQLVEGLKASGGVRRTKDTREILSSNYRTVPFTCNLPDALAGCVRGDKSEFAATTWNISLEYQVTPDLFTYVATRKGYKSGGFNSSSPLATNRVFEPEYAMDVELGAKYRVDTDFVRGRLEAAVYRTRFTNIQVSNTVFDPGINRSFTVVRNAAAGTIKGLELEAALNFGGRVELNGFYAHTRAHYTRYPVPTLTAVIDLSTAPFRMTPKDKYGVTGAYNFGLGDLGNLRTAAIWTWQSRTLLSSASRAVPYDVGYQGSYGTLDLRADWTHIAGGNLDLGVFVTNATNKTYYTSVSDTLDSIGIAFATYGEPRMYGAELKVRF